MSKKQIVSVYEVTDLKGLPGEKPHYYFVTDPDGYKVEGIDKFNMNVDNATGFFKSTAKVEGNQLILTASKGYKTISEKKEAWPDMVKFLDEAYKFTQLKVVLKKA